MIISIITKDIRLTALYKYILLQEELKKEHIELKIFILNSFYYEIKKFMDSLNGKKEYLEYLDYLKILNFVICEDQNKRFNEEQMMNSEMVKQGIFDSDYVFYVSDKRVKINIPNNKGLIDKTIAIKTRSCNDIYYHSMFANRKSFNTWVPSEIYSNHSSIENQINIAKSTNPRSSCKIDFVSPLEQCDIPNPYINLNEDYIVNKYNLDNNKKTILYYFTVNDRNEDLIAKKFLSDEKLKEKYNLLLADKPYSFAFSISTRTRETKNLKDCVLISKYSDIIIDYVDYEWILNNMIYCIIGGISTAIREALVCNVPVLSVSKENITRFLGNDIPTHEFLKKRFNKEVSKTDQFEGLETSLNEDWIPYLERIRDQEYDFKIKRNMWCGNISLKDKIIKLREDLKNKP